MAFPFPSIIGRMLIEPLRFLLLDRLKYLYKQWIPQQTIYQLVIMGLTNLLDSILQRFVRIIIPAGGSSPSSPLLPSTSGCSWDRRHLGEEVVVQPAELVLEALLAPVVVPKLPFHALH